MTYHYDDDTNGEQHACTEEELTDGGFTVYSPGETTGGLSGSSEDDRRTDAYLADADLETPEGCAGALSLLRVELEASGELPRREAGGS
jgi:hypothetical protein